MVDRNVTDQSITSIVAMKKYLGEFQLGPIVDLKARKRHSLKNPNKSGRTSVLN